MHERKSVLLVAMPFAGVAIPSIQLPILEGYLKEREIPIATKHLYLKAAEFYGMSNYHYLITKPNESYTAQMAYSKYVFPDHWEKNKETFREYYTKIAQSHDELRKNLSFDEYVNKTDLFYHWVIDNVNWKAYDIIGFTLNYGQFLPSLAIAKKIKELHPEKKIVFGGSRTVGDIGKNVLNTFDYVDYIVSGEGEEALYLLAFDLSHVSSIPNLIYRDGEKVIWNKSTTFIDLNTLPFLNFDPFYTELRATNDDVTQYFLYHGRLPIENCRGCWWNKCSFCNYNIPHPCYREKTVKRIVDEIQYLSDKYTMLNFQLIGNMLPKKNSRLLFEEIKKLGRDFNIFTEARAGELTSDDYQCMKEAGFINIQTGVESLSQNYLKKINKRVRVIDNIAALKLCKENGIRNEYNLIVNYPNEEKIDFKETKKNIQWIKQFLDPPNINKLLVGYGSAIYNNPDLFNIEKLEYTDIDKVMYPEEILHKDISFYFSFKKKTDLGENNWDELITEWKNNAG